MVPLTERTVFADGLSALADPRCPLRPHGTRHDQSHAAVRSKRCGPARSRFAASPSSATSRRTRKGPIAELGHVRVLGSAAAPRAADAG